MHIMVAIMLQFSRFRYSKAYLALPRLQWYLTRSAWVRLNRLRTGTGRFRSNMHRWGLAPSAACECGAEEQNADHLITKCPIFKAPNGMHGLVALDEDSKAWLTTICPEV